jgi:hypothetical protein
LGQSGQFGNTVNFVGDNRVIFESRQFAEPDEKRAHANPTGASLSKAKCVRASLQ